VIKPTKKVPKITKAMLLFKDLKNIRENQELLKNNRHRENMLHRRSGTAS
jgi:hypothetical protein